VRTKHRLAPDRGGGAHGDFRVCLQLIAPPYRGAPRRQGCQIFLGKIYQNGYKVPNFQSAYKLCIPMGRKILQITIKYL
jgi:hypothetical protein